MARHRAPRSPFLTRRRLVAFAGLFGVSGAVVLGVLISPGATENVSAAPRPSTPEPAASPAPSGPSAYDRLPGVLADRSHVFVVTRAAARQAEADRLAAEEAERLAAEERARQEAEDAARVREATEEARGRQEAAGDTQRPTPAAPAAEPPVVNEPLTPAPAPAVEGKPTSSSSSFSLWAPHVRLVVADVVARFGIGTVYTRPGHSPTQTLAADFMTTDRAKGDAVAAYLLTLPSVEYVIWQQRINFGSGWEFMEDRGSVTANHYDHVHASFF